MGLVNAEHVERDLDQDVYPYPPIKFCAFFDFNFLSVFELVRKNLINS